MKHNKIIITALLLIASLTLDAVPVRVSILDGIDNAAAKAKMENTLSALLTEINNADSQNRELTLKKLGISEFAQQSIEMMWENSHFSCTDNEIVEHCIETGSGYQIRNIPLLMKPVSGSDDMKQEFQEAVVSFDKAGNLTTFYLTIATNLYMEVIKSNLELTDLRRRQLILDYVERFRTSYNQKDLGFLELVFSDDALIITGKVVPQKGKDNIPLPDKITYRKQSKQEYLTNLKRIFGQTKYIRVTFDQIKVRRHPSNPNFYGVTLHQGYTSSSYHDEGYLFLLWDFTDENLPLIHVRTWQPDEFNGSKLPESDIFSLEDFDII